MQNQKKAFTLIELIVVVVILAILWTIAFISMKDYSKWSRNSVRITDVWLMKQSLWIFEVETWKYPISWKNEEINYKGGLLWYQWTFDDKVRWNLENISKVPMDPLLNLEYDYSVTSNKNKYQIWTIIEWSMFADARLTYSANAADYWDIESYVTWNYDQFTVLSQSWSNCYLLPIPSLFVNNASSTGSLTTGIDHYFIFDSSNNISKNYWVKISDPLVPTPFVIEESLNSCSVDTIDELNIYISNLAVTYQQLIWTNDFKEIIYNYAVPTFKVWMIENLTSNWISVDSELSRLVLNPVDSNLFTDLFTAIDWTNLIGTHTTDTLESWTNTWALNNSSYIINWNELIKNNTNDGVIYPETIFPVSYIDRSIIFNISDFSSWEIIAYSSYYNEDNYFWVALYETWYEFRHLVWWVSQPWYPRSWTYTYWVNPLIELIILWSGFELLIDSITPEWVLIDPLADMGWKPGLKISNIWWKIDNYNLIYK